MLRFSSRLRPLSHRFPLPLFESNLPSLSFFPSSRLFSHTASASDDSQSLEQKKKKKETKSIEIPDGPSLGYFIGQGIGEGGEGEGGEGEGGEQIQPNDPPPYLLALEQQDEEVPLSESGKGKKVYVETYGCQMNVSDSEIVMAMLKSASYELTDSLDSANIVLLNTCAIRDNAESKIWDRLRALRGISKKRPKGSKYTVGILGCMAERLKTKLLEGEKLVDLVVGPDAYRDLPRLLAQVNSGQAAINVLLSLEETYADVTPVRHSTNQVSAFVSIMRGCNNMCSYCIVPFTRGRERSRPVGSILEEVKVLSEQGFKEVTLLGQNVNSYNDLSTPSATIAPLADGFTSICKVPQGGTRFAELVDLVSQVDPEMRVRFTSPHPKDFPVQLLQLIKERDNVCNAIHMPAQSGSTSVLKSMRRGYSRESYLQLADTIRDIIPGVTISSDFISGFCGESEEDHEDTISLLEKVRFDQAFMFAYSLREKTHAHRRLEDNVPQETKLRRLREVISTFYTIAKEKNQSEIGRVHLVLVDGKSKKSKEEWAGRTDTNKRVVFPETEQCNSIKLGDYVAVQITSASYSMRGLPLCRTTLQSFNNDLRANKFDIALGATEGECKQASSLQ